MAKDNLLHLEIVAPSGITFEEDVESVSLPAVYGTITILPHHAPLFTKLDEGEIEINYNGKKTSIVIAGGFLEVKNNSAHVLSDYAIRADSIEMAKTEAKKKLAEEKLREKTSNQDFTLADKDLRMSILELKVAEKIKKRNRVNS